MPIIAAPIVTLTQGKTFLNISGTGSDTELTDFIAAASQVIVDRVGPVAGSPSLDEWYDGGSPRLMLNESPIQSITSVTETIGTVVHTLTNVTLDSGSSGTPYGFTVDLDLGMLVRRSSGAAVPFAPGLRNIHVVYVAGYATIPSSLTQATLLLLKHMWETQRGSTGRPGSGPGPTDAFTLPNRVEEILIHYTTFGA